MGSFAKCTCVSEGYKKISIVKSDLSPADSCLTPLTNRNAIGLDDVAKVKVKYHQQLTSPLLFIPSDRVHLSKWWLLLQPLRQQQLDGRYPLIAFYFRLCERYCTQQYFWLDYIYYIKAKPHSLSDRLITNSQEPPLNGLQWHVVHSFILGSRSRRSIRTVSTNSIGCMILTQINIHDGIICKIKLWFQTIYQFDNFYKITYIF